MALPSALASMLLSLRMACDHPTLALAAGERLREQQAQARTAASDAGVRAAAPVEVLAEAMAWLIGDEEAVDLDRSTSYHGPEMTLVKASTANERRAVRSFARLGEANLRQLIAEFDQRVDQHNVLHFRLSMDSLIRGEPELVNTTGTGTVKGQAKFEVYSGLPADEQLQTTFDEALELAARNGA